MCCASAAVYEAGIEFAIGKITMVANTRTYLDTPAHRFRSGHDLSGLALERCAWLPAVVIDGDGPMGAEVFDDAAIEGRAVLLRTGWDRHWSTDRYGDPVHPHLTEVGAHALVAADRSAFVTLVARATGALPSCPVVLVQHG